MKVTLLETSNKVVRLVPIDVERDAPHGVEWLKGEGGRETLRRMGVTDEYNHESNVAAERERLQKIIDDPNELAWMIELNNQVIGITEVHLDSYEGLPGPSIHIMIGDPAARGHGVGSTTLKAVVTYLRVEKQAVSIFSRHLTDNLASAALLQKVGFVDQSSVYRTADGLEWQNMVWTKYD